MSTASVLTGTVVASGGDPLSPMGRMFLEVAVPASNQRVPLGCGAAPAITPAGAASTRTGLIDACGWLAGADEVPAPQAERTQVAKAPRTSRRNLAPLAVVRFLLLCRGKSKGVATPPQSEQQSAAT